MTKKYALLISNSDYEDKTLAQLVSPESDARALAEVLEHPDIGAFEDVQMVLNRPSHEIQEVIASFFAKRKRDDLLILYFTGHGVLDRNGRLYLAAPNTSRDLLVATGVKAEFITEVMDACRSQRKVLILDCCHSGAFARGSKSATNVDVGIGTIFEGSGYGHVVLTATDSTQYAWEGDKVTGSGSRSVFTNYLVEGLATGDADLNGNGTISVNELYDYAYAGVMASADEGKPQTPGKWAWKEQGDIVLAASIKGVTTNPTPLPAAPPTLSWAQISSKRLLVMKIFAVIGAIGVALMLYPYWVATSEGLKMLNHCVSSTNAQAFAMQYVSHDRRDFAELNIAYQSDASGNRNIFLVEEEGKTAVQVTWMDVNKAGEPDSQVKAERPQWSPDGEWIGFMASCGGDKEIYRVRPDGTGLEQITDNDVDDYTPRWSPDGDYIAFHRTINSKTKAIFIRETASFGDDVDNGDNETVLLMEKNLQYLWPSWSPERLGLQLVVWHEPIDLQDNKEIYLIENVDDVINNNAVAPSLTLLTDRNDLDPFWSPNGDKIAFYSHRVDPPQIYTLDLSGETEPQRLDSKTGDILTGWSADGGKLLYHTQKEHIMYSLDLDTKERTLVTKSAAQGVFGAWRP